MPALRLPLLALLIALPVASPAVADGGSTVDRLVEGQERGQKTTTERLVREVEERRRDSTFDRLSGSATATETKRKD